MCINFTIKGAANSLNDSFALQKEMFVSSYVCD